MKRTSKNYFLVSLLFLIISLCTWSYFLFLVHRLDSAARTLETQAAEDYTKKDALVATQTLAKNVAPLTLELTDAFASSTEIADVVDMIEKEGTAQSVAVKVQSISSASSTDPALLSLDMDITASGSWANLVAFSGSIERMPYAMALTKASFFQGGNSKGGWGLSAHITSFLTP